MVNMVLEHQLLERIGRRTLLGIRFWDPALDVQIKDGLRVTLSPVENIDKTIIAYRTHGGIYAFDNIPGMREVETALSEDDIGSPFDTRAYVLTVGDMTGQFSDVAQVVTLPLPYSGLFLVDSDIGSPGDRAKGFNLYSSINRTPQSQYCCIRGELIDTDAGEPAANALIRVETQEGSSWYGLSDQHGKFSVMMPYPFLHVAYGSSPPVSESIRLFQRTWNIGLSVMYTPSTQEPVAGTDKPSYFSLLSQSQALIYQHSPGSAAGETNELTTQLNYGRDLIVSTDGFSELYINPTGSPA